MPGHLASGEQQVLSGQDVVDSLGAIDVTTNSYHRTCHGILNNHECSRQLLNTIPTLHCAYANWCPLLVISEANVGLDVLINRNVRFLVPAD